MAPLRKTIDLDLLGEQVSVDVTFEIIEIVERVYDMRAEYVAAQLSRPVKILRKDIADVIAGWVVGRSSHTRREIREAVMTAKGDALKLYIGAIQGAVLYSLREITDEDLERLVAGRDLDDEPEPDKKKPEASASSIAATASQ